MISMPRMAFAAAALFFAAEASAQDAPAGMRKVPQPDAVMGRSTESDNTSGLRSVPPPAARPLPRHQKSGRASGLHRASPSDTTAIRRTKRGRTSGLRSMPQPDVIRPVEQEAERPAQF